MHCWGSSFQHAHDETPTVPLCTIHEYSAGPVVVLFVLLFVAIMYQNTYLCQCRPDKRTRKQYQEPVGALKERAHSALCA